MNTDTTPTPRTDVSIWRLTQFSSALLEHDGETCNEIHCASHDEAECLVDLLNKKERELAEKTNEVARLRDQIEKLKSIADRACNLLNLKGGYHESYELRNEIQKLKATVNKTTPNS